MARLVTEQRILFACLYLILHVIDSQGEEAASWYDESMSTREILNRLLKDRATRVERLSMLVCTLKSI